MNNFPDGWDELRTRAVADYYEQCSVDELIAEDEGQTQEGSVYDDMVESSDQVNDLKITKGDLNRFLWLASLPQTAQALGSGLDALDPSLTPDDWVEETRHCIDQLMRLQGAMAADWEAEQALADGHQEPAPYVEQRQRRHRRLSDEQDP